MKKTRRKFLKEVCPSVAFAFFGLSFLEACSTDQAEFSGSENEIDDGLGFIQQGNQFTIDLSHSNFTSLTSVGGWFNGHSIGLQMLFLRISENDIQAYDNSCPHNGTRNLWVLDGSRFQCNDHGYSFESENCDGPGLSLNCYGSEIEGSSLIVTV